MDKLYEITFTQMFEEVRTVKASSEEDAREKLDDVWGCGTGAEVQVHSIEEVPDENSDPEDMGTYV